MSRGNREGRKIFPILKIFWLIVSCTSLLHNVLFCFLCMELFFLTNNHAITGDAIWILGHAKHLLSQQHMRGPDSPKCIVEKKIRNSYLGWLLVETRSLSLFLQNMNRCCRKKCVKKSLPNMSKSLPNMSKYGCSYRAKSKFFYSETFSYSEAFSYLANFSIKRKKYCLKGRYFCGRTSCGRNFHLIYFCDFASKSQN